MKKQTAVLIWAAVVLFVIVVCCAAYFVWDSGASDVAGNTPVEVFTCKTSLIEEYTVERNDSSYTLEKEDGEWVECCDYVLENTFWHEFGHVLQYYGIGENNEAFAQAFATFIMEFNKSKK